MQMRLRVTAAAAARLFYTHRIWKERKRSLVETWSGPRKKKKPTIVTCTSSLSLSLSAACVILPFIDLCVCVSEQGKNSLISCTIFHQAEEKVKEKKSLREEERDGPISLSELTNAISQKFISLLPLNGF